MLLISHELPENRSRRRVCAVIPALVIPARLTMLDLVPVLEQPISARLVEQRLADDLGGGLAVDFEEGLVVKVVKLDHGGVLQKATIGEKIGVIRKQVRSGSRLPWLEFEERRALRNKICHLNLTDEDLDIVNELLSGKFFTDADHIINWLRIASKRLGFECHPNAPQILRECSDAVRSAAASPAAKPERS